MTPLCREIDVKLKILFSNHKVIFNQNWTVFSIRTEKVTPLCQDIDNFGKSADLLILIVEWWPRTFEKVYKFLTLTVLSIFIYNTDEKGCLFIINYRGVFLLPLDDWIFEKLRTFKYLSWIFICTYILFRWFFTCWVIDSLKLQLR